jgi:glycosyltransferase involved in cell wall biosynthesis
MSDAGNRRRKVCFALPSLAGGGAERAAVQILNALDGDRWERWMYLFTREGPYLADVSPAIRIEGPTNSPLIGRVGRWRALRRFVRLVRPDVVVAFLSYFSVLGATRTARAGARVVFDQQTPLSAFLGDSDYHWSRPWHRRMFAAVTRVGFAAADLIVTTSRGVADELVRSFGVSSERVRVVPNPVDLAMIAAAATEPIDPSHAAVWTPPVIVAAGRLAEAKNYPLLVEAFAILRQRTSAQLFILGEGDQEPALRALIETKGLTDVIHLCGFQRNPWKYIARADVFALTSKYEGFGNVLVEAMACGVPVVATSSPGSREIVDVGAGGLLVEPHEPAAVAAALDQVLCDSALRGRMSEAARRHAERYGTASIAAAYDRVLTEALA